MIYPNQNNRDLRGKKGVRLYAKEDLWYDGRIKLPPATIGRGMPIDALLIDDQGDLAFLFRGMILVGHRDLFSTDPIDAPPPPSTFAVHDGVADS